MGTICIRNKSIAIWKSKRTTLKEGEKIIEIACVELSNFVPTGEIYQTFINPERKSNSSAKEKHGISDDFLKDKKLFREIASDFLKFIKNSPIIAHNGLLFDVPFLNYELKSNKFNFLKNLLFHIPFHLSMDFYHPNVY